MNLQVLASSAVHILKSQSLPPTPTQDFQAPADMLVWCTLFCVLPGMPRRSEGVVANTWDWVIGLH